MVVDILSGYLAALPLLERVAVGCGVSGGDEGFVCLAHGRDDCAVCGDVQVVVYMVGFKFGALIFDQRFADSILGQLRRVSLYSFGFFAFNLGLSFRDRSLDGFDDFVGVGGDAGGDQLIGLDVNVNLGGKDAAGSGVADFYTVQLGVSDVSRIVRLGVETEVLCIGVQAVVVALVQRWKPLLSSALIIFSVIFISSLMSFPLL